MYIYIPYQIMGFYLTWLVYVLIIFRPRSCWVQRVRHYVQRYIPWWRPICARHTDSIAACKVWIFLIQIMRGCRLDVCLDVQKLKWAYSWQEVMNAMVIPKSLVNHHLPPSMVSRGEGLTSLSYHIDAGWSITMAWGFTNLSRTYQKMPLDSNFEVRSLEIRDRTW